MLTKRIHKIRPLLRPVADLIERNSYVQEYLDDSWQYRIHLYQKYSTGKVEPIEGRADAKGTQIFSFRRENVLQEHFNWNYNKDVLHSSISYGTYKADISEKGEVSMFSGILDSVYSGVVNTFDTGIHWRYQRSERTIGAAIKYLIQHEILRNEVFIASRAGHIDVVQDLFILRKTMIEESISMLARTAWCAI